MPTNRGTLDSAAPNTGVPNGALSSRGTFRSAGGAGSSVARPVARRATPPPRGGVRLGTPGFAVLEDEYHVFNSADSAGSSVARPVARRGTPLLRGVVRLGTLGLATPENEVQYHVYTNTVGSTPIDYGSPVATVSATTWMSGTLRAPGTWRFGVRAFNGNGEEQNLDCSVTIVLDAYGNDITNRPLPPTGLRAFATANGGVRAEWWYPPTAGAKAPTGFHVYCTAGSSVSYEAPSATVLYGSGLFNTFVSNIAGLSNGTQYAIGVRAYNASGEEQNTTAVAVTADATGPTAVLSLTAVAIV